MNALEYAYTVRAISIRIIKAWEGGRPAQAHDLTEELAAITGRFIAAEEKRHNDQGGDPGLETPARYDLTVLRVEENPDPGE